MSTNRNNERMFVQVINEFIDRVNKETSKLTTTLETFRTEFQPHIDKTHMLTNEQYDEMIRVIDNRLMGCTNSYWFLTNENQTRISEAIENYNKICEEMEQQKRKYISDINKRQFSFGLEGLVRTNLRKGIEPETIEQEFAMNLPTRPKGGRKTRRRRNKSRRK